MNDFGIGYFIEKRKGKKKKAKSEVKNGKKIGHYRQHQKPCRSIVKGQNFRFIQTTKYLEPIKRMNGIVVVAPMLRPASGGFMKYASTHPLLVRDFSAHCYPIPSQSSLHSRPLHNIPPVYIVGALSKLFLSLSLVELFPTLHFTLTIHTLGSLCSRSQPSRHSKLYRVASGITMNFHSFLAKLASPNILQCFDLCEIFAKYSV